MSEHSFKTIYFPGSRTRTGKSARVTVSLPAQPDGSGTTREFLRYANSISSRDFRLALGDPYLEDLEGNATADGRSLSAICLRLLSKRFAQPVAEVEKTSDAQMSLSFGDRNVALDEPAQDAEQVGVSFRESQRHRVHGWYPYVEGFSATYVRDAILRDGPPPRNVFDPFGGAGTTQLVAASLGIPSYFCEINPLMAFVAETKVNATSWARRNLARWSRIAEAYLRRMTEADLERFGRRADVASIESAFPDRDFFVERDLRHLLAARDLADEIADGCPEARSLLRLAVAANVVASSNMTRRADLRRRRDNEYKNRVVDVATSVAKSVKRMIEDIPHLPTEMGPMTFVAPDCRNVSASYANAFDLAVTSPPYLNGTNYFRNTKIELWILGFIASEKELGGLCRRAVAGGINNVSFKQEYRRFDFVEEIASKLDVCAGDRRIPLLVRRYFSDMYDVLSAVHRSLVPGKQFLLDMGDSRFYGVHVPTDKLLCRVAEQVGFRVEHEHFLAKRFSRDKTELVQVELVFRKPSDTVPTKRTALAGASRAERISEFAAQLPYKNPPYASRNWGHGLHSLCSYQGKLKPSIAHWMLRDFVPANGRVLDPIGGVGTIAFEAALAGRESVSNDMSPFAAIVAKAKLAPPTPAEADAAIERLVQHMEAVEITSEDRLAADFGLNATVADYYHPRTLDEVLRARKVFRDDRGGGRGDNFIWASLLHVLHGNRPYALSRTSHPIVPFHPTGPAEYRSLIQKVRDRVRRALAEPLPAEFRPGLGLEGDFRDLPKAVEGRSFDAIITSPPFIGMRFDRPNWLRLWFCGWGESDFHKTSLGYLERQQSRSRDCYSEFFQVCRRLIVDDGLLVIHLGSGGKSDMVGDLKRLAKTEFDLLEDVRENVQAIEQHGLRDKGLTTAHHLLFFQPA